MYYERLLLLRCEEVGPESVRDALLPESLYHEGRNTMEQLEKYKKNKDSREYLAAVKSYENQTRQAEKNGKMVIAFSHTHPDINEYNRRDARNFGIEFRQEKVITVHSDLDYLLAVDQQIIDKNNNDIFERGNNLPDVIISFSKFNEKVSEVAILTMDAKSKYDFVYINRSFSTFLSDLFFTVLYKYIITQYHERIKQTE